MTRGSTESQYEWSVGYGARLLAVAGYLSFGFGGAVLIPIAIWVLFRDRFLRTHALNAGLLHVVGLAVTGVLYAAHFAWVLETPQGILSLAQLWGHEFTSTPLAWGTVLLLESLLFWLWFARSAGIREVRRGRPHFVNARSLPVKGLIAIPLVVLLFYNQMFWPSVSGAGDLINSGRFRDPFVLVPGHLILCACMAFAMIAFEGRLHRFGLARRLYGRFLREERARGELRARAARLRSGLLPGWGQAYLGHYASGIATTCAFLLVLLFATISFWMNYGRLVESLPGYNANAAWYFLSELGLRSHIPDKVFLGLFGNPYALGILVLALLAIWLFARNASAYLARPVASPGWRAAFSHSLLLHLTPVAILLLIPVSFQLTSSEPPTKQELFRYIPEFFELPKERMRLDGATTSGDESKTYGRPGRPSGKEDKSAGSNTRVFPGPGPAAGSRRGKSDDRLVIDERTGKDPQGGRPGKRQDMTYSNYLSAKIRGSEKGLGYWDRVPRPYSAVFEYKISASGELYDLKVVQPSRDSEADRLTLELIRAMGTVLPPPGGGHAVVRELFWNTVPGDTSLPTPMQRALSHAFDGRVIRRF